ncbi:ABC transporter substrate-binding protein [Hyphobacterium sp. CCMP332]|nr:ABC transporter substrate-binding protein [Hyphobacterium sp. CCMP332]
MARTQACNYPPQAMNKTVISTYPFDIESIIGQKPDLVFSEEGITTVEQLKILEENQIPVYMFRYRRVEDIFMAIEKTGQLCNCSEQVDVKMNKLKQRFDTVKEDSLSDVKALGLIWTDPIYVYGRNTLFTGQLKEIGVENAVDSIFGRPYPELNREYFLKINPNVIFGPSFEHLDSTLFLKFPELKRIDAYKNKHIFEIDGDILTRPSPRSIEAMILMKSYIDEI